MNPRSAAAAIRYQFVVLFFPFSALDKVLNFAGAVAQAKEVLPEGRARLAVFAGLGVEIAMPLAVLTGTAERGVSCGRSSSALSRNFTAGSPGESLARDAPAKRRRSAVSQRCR